VQTSKSPAVHPTFLPFFLACFPCCAWNASTCQLRRQTRSVNAYIPLNNGFLRSCHRVRTSLSVDLAFCFVVVFVLDTNNRSYWLLIQSLLSFHFPFAPRLIPKRSWHSNIPWRSGFLSRDLSLLMIPDTTFLCSVVNINFEISSDKLFHQYSRCRPAVDYTLFSVRSAFSSDLIFISLPPWTPAEGNTISRLHMHGYAILTRRLQL
jgi:hypothetical protein